MIPEFEVVAVWLTETFVHGTAILVIAIAALSSIKQPSRRMPVAWGAFAGLVALAILPALSWWPRIELPAWHSATPIAVLTEDQPTANDEPGARDGLVGQATFGSGIRENSLQISQRVGILTNSAAEDTTPTDPYLASSEPLGADFVVGDEILPAPADVVSVPQDVDAETTIERARSIDVEREPPSSKATLAGLWLAGAFLVSIWIAAGAWRTQRLFGRSLAAPGWVRDDLRRIVPAHRREPTARVSQEIAAALAYGAIRPAILLRDPELRDAQTEPEVRRGIRAALAHEYAHIAHGDLWLLALERLLLPVYFAHPLFWVLRRWIRIDQELLADAAAAADRPVEYAEALLEWAKSAPAAGSRRFSAALPLWSSPCHLKRRIEMLLDAGNPIVRQATRLWRAAVLTTIASVVIGLSLVTFHPAHSAEDTVDRPPAIETISVASGSQERPSPIAEPVSIHPAYIVAFHVTLVHVDNAKLASRGTSLANLVNAACDPAKSSKSRKEVVAGFMSSELAKKLLDDVKVRDAATILCNSRSTFVFETNPVQSSPSPADTAVADRRNTFSLQSGRPNVMLRIHTKPIERGRNEPIRLKVSMGVEYAPQADSDSSVNRDLEVLSSSTRTISYAAQVQLGESLVIADGSNHKHAAGDEYYMNLFIVTPLTATPTEDPNSQTAQSRDVEALRQVVKELKDEIRGLRQQSPQGPDRPGSADTRPNLEYELLLLDVQEADLDEVAAREAYFAARQLKNANAASQAERANYLAAWRKAKVALDRAKLRAAAGERRQHHDDPVPVPRGGDRGDDEPDDAASLAEKLRQLEAQEAQVDLDAAKSEYDAASALHAKGALSDSKLAACKLALQKAEIALRRAKLRLEVAKSAAAKSSNMANPEPDANAEANAARNLTITVTAAEDGQVAALALLSQKPYEGTVIKGPLDDQRLAALDRQLKQLVAIEGQPYDHVLIRVQKSVKYQEVVKVIDVCKNQKTAGGKPFRVSFVVMTENPPKPDPDGAATRESKAEERHITLRARIVEVPDSSLQQIRAAYSDALNPNKFFAEIASDKEATMTGILDAGDATLLNELLDANKKAKVVLDSRVTVRSGHSARFLSKGEVAVISPADNDASGADSISFRGAGITLSVVAIVQDRDLIRLQIVPEVSAIDAEKTVDGIPGVNTRRVQTTVELREGQTVALTGPQLSPDSNTRVLILLTPEIVRSTDPSAVPNPESPEATGSSSDPPTVGPKTVSSQPKTQPANSDAAIPRDDDFGLERKLEEQLAPPLSAPPTSSVFNIPPPTEPNIAPELEVILTAWMRAVSRIERLQCTFTQFTYDHAHLVETRAEGSIVVDAPDRAFYCVTPTNLNGSTSSPRKRDGKAYALRTEDRDLAWMWSGGRVVHLDMRRKIYESAPLGDGDQPPAADDQFFLARPFLLGMSVPNLIQRFSVSIKRRHVNEVWLSFTPRQSQPPAPYREAILILAMGDWQPRALKLTDPRGDVESVHVFKQFVVNPLRSLTKQHLLDANGVTGFREITLAADAARPWHVASGREAIFRSWQQLISTFPLGNLEMSTVLAARSEFPATLGTRFRGGVKVTAVAKGGIADAAGIRPDDLLVGLHVWELRRQEDLDEAIRKIATLEDAGNWLDTDGVTVLLIRDGELTTTTIKPKP